MARSLVGGSSWFSGCVLVLAACNESAPEPTVTEWLGHHRHGEIRGALDGEDVDVMAGASQVGCKREYVVPEPDDESTYAEGRLDELEISFYATVDGIEHWYELELFDLGDVAVGKTLTVVSSGSEHPAVERDEVHAEFAWEWESDDFLVTDEAVAVRGTVDIHELSGEAGPDGLVIPAGQGNVGALVRLELPDGEVGISFTAPCSIVEIDPID